MPTVDRGAKRIFGRYGLRQNVQYRVCENCTISWATAMMVGEDARYDTAVMNDGRISLFGSDVGMRTSPRMRLSSCAPTLRSITRV